MWGARSRVLTTRCVAAATQRTTAAALATATATSTAFATAHAFASSVATVAMPAYAAQTQAYCDLTQQHASLHSSFRSSFSSSFGTLLPVLSQQPARYFSPHRSGGGSASTNNHGAGVSAMLRKKPSVTVPSSSSHPGTVTAAAAAAAVAAANAAAAAAAAAPHHSGGGHFDVVTAQHSRFDFINHSSSNSNNNINSGGGGGGGVGGLSSGGNLSPFILTLLSSGTATNSVGTATAGGFTSGGVGAPYALTGSSTGGGLTSLLDASLPLPSQRLASPEARLQAFRSGYINYSNKGVTSDTGANLSAGNVVGSGAGSVGGETAIGGFPFTDLRPLVLDGPLTEVLTLSSEGVLSLNDEAKAALGLITLGGGVGSREATSKGVSDAYDEDLSGSSSDDLPPLSPLPLTIPNFTYAPAQSSSTGGCINNCNTTNNNNASPLINGSAAMNSLFGINANNSISSNISSAAAAAATAHSHSHHHHQPPLPLTSLFTDQHLSAPYSGDSSSSSSGERVPPPYILRDAHLAYLASGADVLTTMNLSVQPEYLVEVLTEGRSALTTAASMLRCHDNGGVLTSPDLSTTLSAMISQTGEAAYQARAQALRCADEALTFVRQYVQQHDTETALALSTLNANLSSGSNAKKGKSNHADAAAEEEATLKEEAARLKSFREDNLLRKALLELSEKRPELARYAHMILKNHGVYVVGYVAPLPATAAAALATAVTNYNSAVLASATNSSGSHDTDSSGTSASANARERVNVGLSESDAVLVFFYQQLLAEHTLLCTPSHNSSTSGDSASCDSAISSTIANATDSYAETHPADLLRHDTLTATPPAASTRYPPKSPLDASSDASVSEETVQRLWLELVAVSLAPWCDAFLCESSHGIQQAELTALAAMTVNSVVNKAKASDNKTLNKSSSDANTGVDVTASATASANPQQVTVGGTSTRTGTTAVPIPVWVSFRLNDTDYGVPRLYSCETLAQAVDRLLNSLPRFVDGYLFNCSSPTAVTAALPLLRKITKRPIGAYAKLPLLSHAPSYSHAHAHAHPHAHAHAHSQTPQSQRLQSRPQAQAQTQLPSKLGSNPVAEGQPASNTVCSINNTASAKSSESSNQDSHLDSNNAKNNSKNASSSVRANDNANSSARSESNNGVRGKSSSRHADGSKGHSDGSKGSSGIYRPHKSTSPASPLVSHPHWLDVDTNNNNNNNNNSNGRVASSANKSNNNSTSKSNDNNNSNNISASAARERESDSASVGTSGAAAVNGAVDAHELVTKAMADDAGTSSQTSANVNPGAKFTQSQLQSHSQSPQPQAQSLSQSWQVPFGLSPFGPGGAVADAYIPPPLTHVSVSEHECSGSDHVKINDRESSSVSYSTNATSASTTYTYNTAGTYIHIPYDEDAICSYTYITRNNNNNTSSANNTHPSNPNSTANMSAMNANSATAQSTAVSSEGSGNDDYTQTIVVTSTEARRAAAPLTSLLHKTRTAATAGEAASAFAALAERWGTDWGVDVLGGCCGAGPGHVRQLAVAAHKVGAKRRESKALGLLQQQLQVAAVLGEEAESSSE